MTTTRIHVCVACREPVRVSGTGPLRRATGHRDPRLDQTCGRWGFRRVTVRKEGQ
jgi:hypothetical protein